MKSAAVPQGGRQAGKTIAGQVELLHVFKLLEYAVQSADARLPHLKRIVAHGSNWQVESER